MDNADEYLEAYRYWVKLQDSLSEQEDEAHCEKLDDLWYVLTQEEVKYVEKTIQEEKLNET